MSLGGVTKSTYLQMAADFVVTLVVIGIGAWVLFAVPSWRPEVFSSVSAASAITVGISTAITLAITAIRAGWIAKFVALFGIGGAITVSAYVAGAFILERLGVAPSFSSWSNLGSETILFFGLYTSLTCLLILWIRFVRSLSKREVDESKLTSSAALRARLMPYLVALALPFYFAGLVVADWFGWGSIFSFDGALSTDFLSFLAVYTAAFLALPLAVIVAGLLLFWIGRLLLRFFRGIGRTETWQRVRGARLSKKELDARLLMEREAREDRKREMRLQRDAEFIQRIEQRRQEIKDFGPVTARLIWWAPYITGGVQFFSFITSYLGIRIFLGLTQENEALVDRVLSLPFSLPLLGDEIRVHLLFNDVIAASISAFMAIMIWYLSTLAVARVQGFQRVPFVVFVFIFGLGTVSTYTAFIMWNGELATREEMAVSQRQTERFLAEVSAEDDRVLVNAVRDVQSQVSRLESQRLAAQITHLSDYLQDLKSIHDLQARSFSGVAVLSRFLETRENYYQTYVTCEREIGCLSNLGGRGQVVKQLEQNVETFRANLVTWTRISTAREDFSSQARAAIDAATNSLENADTSNAEQSLIRLRSAIIGADGQNPQVVIDAVKAQLEIPISANAPRASQREALEELKAGVSRDINQLQSIQSSWVDKELNLPPIVSSTDAGQEFGRDIGILTQIQGELEELLDNRSRQVRSFEADLRAVEQTIILNMREDLLIPNSTEIHGEINRLRDDIEVMGTIDLRPTMARFALVDSYQEGTGIAAPALETNYPRIEDFSPTFLAFLVLDYAYLSVVTLAVQILLDFGYTLILVITVSRLVAPRNRGRVA